MKDETELGLIELTTSSDRGAGEALSSFLPHPSSFRALLWDIDGTLMRSTRAGSFKDYTIPMLEEVFGTAGRLPEMRVSGMTDLQIVGEGRQKSTNEQASTRRTNADTKKNKKMK